MDAKDRAKWLMKNKDKFADIEVATKVSRSTIYSMARNEKRKRLPYVLDAIDRYITEENSKNG